MSRRARARERECHKYYPQRIEWTKNHRFTMGSRTENCKQNKICKASMMFDESRRFLCTRVPRVSCTSLHDMRCICRSHGNPRKYIFSLTNPIQSARCQSRVWSQGETGAYITIIAEIRTPLENAWRSSQSPHSLPSPIRAATKAVNGQIQNGGGENLPLVLEATTPASRLVPLVCCPLPPQMVAKE